MQCVKSDRQLEKMTFFRIKDVNGRAYRIDFQGESSIDAGGPYRDSIVNVVTEMESGLVPLLIKSPNNRNEHGANRDCFVLDPSSTSPSHLEMYRFLGGFIACGILSKAPIPLNLSPSVWKQILGLPLTLADLDAFDAYSAQVLTDLRKHSKSLSDEEFKETISQNFTTVLSNGDEVILCDGGTDRMVQKSDIDEFIDLVLKARASEATEQVKAIQDGMSTVLMGNLDMISYLTPEAIEIRACGEKTVQIELLKSITEYQRCSADHEAIQRFWRVIESFSHEERMLYLKFVWGRNRLPIDLSNCQKHKIVFMDHMADQGFPQSHTCFFQLDLPFYKTDEMCRKRILSAAELCGSVDTD